MTLVISEENVRAAIEQFLHSMNMIRDDETVVNVKRTRSNDYELKIEKD